MTKKEQDFRVLVKRLISPDFGQNFDPQLLHGFMGMASESGEMLDSYKKWMAYPDPGEKFDRGEMLAEMSDLLHFMEYVLDRLDSDLDELMDINDVKLSTRYPVGFNPRDGATNNRDKVAEKAAIAGVIAEHTRRRELERSSLIPFGEDGRIDNS